MSDEEIDLGTLSDEDLVKQMHDDLYDGLAPEIVEGTEILLSRGWTAEQTLGDALVEGMRIVGIDFRDGILFVPEVLLAANAMKAGMEILRPLLSESDAERMGKVVIGTVKGDIHDIGKNLVAMMLEGAGFEVIDLGINNPVESYLAALDEHKPEILGMSALLTTTMPYMKVVIDTLVEQGRRDDVIVLVGGAPLNEEFGKAIGRGRLLPRRRGRRRDGAGARPRPALVGRRIVSPTSLLDDEVAFDGAATETRVLVLACGAIAREVLAVIELNGWAHVDVRCLPAKLHSTPDRIPAAVDAKLRELAPRYERVFVAYADCGTGGALDPVLERHGVERLPGAHCYGFLAGNDVVGRDPRGRPGDVLPHRFPRPALRRARRARAEARRASRAAAAGVRQLPPARVPGADRRRRPRPARRGGSRVPRPRLRAAPDGLRRARPVAHPLRRSPSRWLS